MEEPKINQKSTFRFFDSTPGFRCGLGPGRRESADFDEKVSFCDFSDALKVGRKKDFMGFATKSGASKGPTGGAAPRAGEPESCRSEIVSQGTGVGFQGPENDHLGMRPRIFRPWRRIKPQREINVPGHLKFMELHEELYV